jgi:hypothetical protein
MLFKRTPIDTLIEDSLYEARRLALEHSKSAEYYAAQARLYRERVARLEAERQQIRPASQEESLTLTF